MESLPAFIILLTVIIPVIALFMKDSNRTRGRMLNILIIAVILFTYYPIIETFITNEPYFWFMFYTVPIGGVCLVVLCVLKFVFKKRKVSPV